MEVFNKEDIIDEEGEIVNFKKLKQITNSGIEKCICKIIIIDEVSDENKFKSGTGFFYDIPEKKIKILLTNNHLINKKFLENEKKLTYEIEEEEKEINLELSRYKLTNEDLDFK
jgi:protein-tyrosine phosphatase